MLFVEHMVVLKVYLWLCAQESFLLGPEGPYWIPKTWVDHMQNKSHIHLIICLAPKSDLKTSLSDGGIKEAFTLTPLSIRA